MANLANIFAEHILQPNYQRRRVWDLKRKSKLIESFIINVPIPSIFLYEIEFSKYEVMDGQQRVSTLLQFFADEFALEGLEIWHELNGKKYSELPMEIQKGINRRYISATILLKETAESESSEMTMKQFVFERLNTGGMQLDPQEIRNALYPGKFNELLIELSKDKLFRKLWGFENAVSERMEDCELVLRFFAYKSATAHKISKGIKALLDTYMKKSITFKENDVEVLRSLFTKTVFLAYQIFGENAFKSEAKSKKSEKMIYDTVMLYMASIIEDLEEQEIDVNEVKFNNLSKKKYAAINSNKELFNGKYTAIKNVSERVDFFEHELKGSIIYDR
nr:DUF262 domain-containing protein [Enterococcus ureilyticus]